MSRRATVVVTKDLSGIERRFSDSSVRKAQKSLALQVGNDSNVYCKVDTGQTRATMASSSDFENGDVSWSTSYAKAAYYASGASHRVNPSAQPQWFEVAKQSRLRNWQETVRKALES